MDFYLFEGKTKSTTRKPINLGGSAKTSLSKQDLFNSIEQERKTREHLRNLEEATQLTQLFIRHQFELAQSRGKIGQELMDNMTRVFDSVDTSVASFLPHFRMIIFGRQIIPETVMAKVIGLAKKEEENMTENVKRSLYYLILKYYLLNYNSLLEPYEFVCFLFERFDSVVVGFGYLKMFEKFISHVSLSLDEIVCLLERFPQSRTKCVFDKLFRCLGQLSNAREELRVLLDREEFCKLFIDNIVCLQSLLELTREIPSLRQLLDLFPFEFTNGIDAESSQILIELVIDLSISSKWIFSVIYCANACQSDAKYFELFCRFIFNFITKIDCIAAIDEGPYSFQIHDRFDKLALHPLVRESGEEILKKFSSRVGNIGTSSEFLRELINCSLTSVSQQLATFSILFLHLQFNSLLYEYSFNSDDMLRAFVKKFHSCHGISYEYHVKNIMLAMIALLDRENCIREFSKVTPLFPPGSCLLSPISGLLEERQLLFSYGTPLSHRINIFHQFRKTKMLSFSRAGETIEVRRGFELEDSLANMNRLGPRSFVKFQNEYGFGPGITKEYVINALTQAFQVDLGAFDVTTGQKLYPSSIQKSPILFELIGKLIAIALMLEIRVDPKTKLDFAFLSACRIGRVTTDDLYFLDTQIYQSLIYLSKHDASNLYLTFSLTSDALEGQQEVDLVPDGRSIAVTNENKSEYIELMANYKLHWQNLEQVLKGINSLIPSELLEMFNEAELCMMISGLADEIDLSDWKSHTKVIGQHSPENIDIFWQAVELLTTKERSELLRFVTGCPRPPLMGFEILSPNFTVQFTGDHLDKLPISHTCFNSIVIPCYNDPAVAVEKLKLAIENLPAGFQVP